MVNNRVTWSFLSNMGFEVRSWLFCMSMRDACRLRWCKFTSLVLGSAKDRSYHSTARSSSLAIVVTFRSCDMQRPSKLSSLRRSATNTYVDIWTNAQPPACSKQEVVTAELSAIRRCSSAPWRWAVLRPSANSCCWPRFIASFVSFWRFAIS